MLFSCNELCVCVYKTATSYLRKYQEGYVDEYLRISFGLMDFAQELLDLVKRGAYK